eukprot:TRINITY_DN287_c0_g1_i2.p1 TRINITY_DN287_c0_g1~~TRINITY_DN287_c0_g1_i2.p1  ORF type:complete len:193 (+),score=24.16 TRINITY_DN287_c0_g1_i2:38-580(+)
MEPGDFSATERPATAPVYLLKLHQYTPGETCSNTLRELREHWVGVVDIDRKSNESEVVGLELHLLRKAPESNVMVLAPMKLGTFTIERLPEWRHIGDIQNLGGETSWRWANSLYAFAGETFLAMAADGNEWGARLNCQQYVRKLLCDLGLQCTDPACGDEMTLLIDCACTLDKWARNHCK